MLNVMINFLFCCVFCAAAWGIYYLGKREGREERQGELDDFETYEEFCNPFDALNNKKEERHPCGVMHISGCDGDFLVENIRIDPKNREVVFTYVDDNTYYALKMIETALCMPIDGYCKSSDYKKDVTFVNDDIRTIFYNSLLVEHNYELKQVRMIADYIG